MKRVKTVLAERRGVRAKITIEVVTEPGHLLSGETDRLVQALASDSMKTLSEVQHLRVPLSEIEVR